MHKVLQSEASRLVQGHVAGSLQKLKQDSTEELQERLLRLVPVVGKGLLTNPIFHCAYAQVKGLKALG